MSEIVGVDGTPAHDARALLLAGWKEAVVAGMWAKAGCTPMHYSDALIVMALQPSVMPDTRKRGTRTTEFRMLAPIVVTMLLGGVAALMGVLPALPEAQRGPVGAVLTSLSGVLASVYAAIRQYKKATEEPEDPQAPKDVN